MCPWKANPANTDGTHETLAIPTSNPQDWFRGSANSSPRSAMSIPTTSLEAVQKMAQLQKKNANNQLGPFGLRDVKEGEK